MRSGMMTSGYGEKERAFLETLEAETGRSLAQWMTAISAENFAERNDVIDWLRRQGFRFSRASWLERVHHNGGRPIYADRPPADPAAARKTLRATAKPRVPAPRTSQPVLGMSFAAKPQVTAVASPPPRPAAEAYAAAAPANVVALTFTDPLSPPITEVTAKAKAYRPLADFLLREIAKAVPSASFAVKGQQILIARARDFATLAVSPRELKLTLATGGTTVLTDARQVDAALLDRVKAAALTAS